MAKRNRFQGKNAQLVDGTRLTGRQMKKMSAAYFNVQRDFQLKLESEKNNPARTTEDVKPANLGELNA